MSYQRSARGGKVTTRSRHERRPSITHPGIYNDDIPSSDSIQTRNTVQINALIAGPEKGPSPQPTSGPEKGIFKEKTQVGRPPRDSCNPADVNHSNVTRPRNPTADPAIVGPEKGLSKKHSSPPATPEKKVSVRRKWILAVANLPSPKKCGTRPKPSPSPAKPSPSPAKPNHKEPAVEVIETESKTPDGNHSTVTLPHGKNIKILIKGLPSDMDSNSIKENLEKTGYHVGKVLQFKKRVGVAYRPLPTLLVIMPASQSNNNIRVERFRGGRLQIQCYKCQGFGHIQANCQQTPKCMKCAAGHFSYECIKDPSTTPTCCNCGKTHTANFSGCEARPRGKRTSRQQKTTAKATTKVSPKERVISLLEELKSLLVEKDIQELFNSLMSKEN